MRLRQFVQTSVFSGALALTVAAAPALAHESSYYSPPQPSWKEDRAVPQAAMDGQAREAWLAECRRRLSSARGDNGLGGAVIGGVIGGVAGNRIAGRGHRTVGTIAGAAVGAAAGMAIDKAEDANERRSLDDCEAYLEDYYAYYRGASPAYGQYGHGYAYPAYSTAMACCQQPMMMVPVMRTVRSEPRCTETVEYEYVDVPVRAKPRPAPDKRVKIVPDKRIKVAPDKRIPVN